jgi:Icc-related predicted phosphoesterase
MKILATADIHGSQYRLNILLDNIERYSPDLVVICGDITQFGPGDVAKNFLNQIPIETLAISGNIDSADVFKAINDSKATNIEMKKVVKKGLPFIGINGENENQTNQFFKENKNLLDETSILVTHVPPYDTQDKIFLGKHGGSKELKKIVDKFKPRLVLCGHIHEDPGYTNVEDTIVVNCSMGKRGEGALIEINKDISVKMLD